MERESANLTGKIRAWFQQRSKFWSLVSVVSLALMICLYPIFAYGAWLNTGVKEAENILLLSLLLMFALGTVWRGSHQTFLSAAGGICVYVGMFYLYAKYADVLSLPAVVTNKLGVGRVVEGAPLAAVANFYFFIGILALVFSLILSFKPSLFMPKYGRTKPPYPVWTNRRAPNLSAGNNVVLVPVQGLLNFAERHLSSKYKYLVVHVGGRVYFVSPEDWVPEGSFIVRDNRSGSLLGIPKIGDGFSIW